METELQGTLLLTACCERGVRNEHACDNGPKGNADRVFRDDKESRLAQVLERNIRAVQRRHEEDEARATPEERIARGVTDFCGRMRFVYLHIAVFGLWIILNLRWISGITPWDPSFVILAVIASVEAIFLSTFVLITQNRMAAVAERRALLDLQVNLLAEHEVTKLIRMVSHIAEHLQVPTEHGAEIDELKHDIAPEAVLDEIEQVR